jgi:hypothetical protein
LAQADELSSQPKRRSPDAQVTGVTRYYKENYLELQQARR